MRLHGEQALVLVLAAEVHRRAHAPGELAHARHVPVHVHAAAAVRAHAPAHHGAVLVVARKEEPALDLERGRPLADHARVGALAHEELDRREQRGLSRARLAGEDVQSRSRLDVRALDDRYVFYVQLPEHFAPR